MASSVLVRELLLHLRARHEVPADLPSKLASSLLDVDGPDVRVDSQLLRREREASGGRGPGLGLELGACEPLLALGPVGDLVACCSTLRVALVELRRFLPLLQTGGDLRVVEAGDLTLVCYDPPPHLGDGSRLAVELALSLFIAISRHFLDQQANPSQVLVSFSEPPDSRSYGSLFKCRCTFGADTCAAVFPTSALDVPQVFPDEKLQRRIAEQLDALNMRQRPPRHLLQARVQRVVARDNLFDSELSRVVAKRMGMTPRQLRRRVAVEGASLRTLVGEVRKQKALNLLSDRQLPIKLIAEQLGYADTSAFHRAFRRWTGMTPHQFLRGGSPAPAREP